MNQNKLFTFLFLSVVVACGIQLQANEPEEIVEFEFQTLLLGKFDSSHAKPLYYQQGSDYFLTSFSLFNLGLPHNFRGSSQFRFYRKVETPDGPEMQVVAQLEGLPVKAKKLFLVVLPGSNGALKLRDIQADETSLNRSEMLLLNFSTEILALSVGGAEVVQIMPGTTGKMPYSIETGKFSFALKVAAQNEEGWRVVHSTMITQVDGAPLFAVAFPDPLHPKQWQVRFLRSRSAP
jgi:hypothetical protein